MRKCKGCGCEDSNNEKSLASRLNKKITILRQTDEQDEYGERLDEWIPVTSNPVWAAIEPLSGQEYFAAKRVNADVTTRIPIRYRDGINRTMIVRYKEEGHPKFAEFEILYTIDPEFKHEELQLMCKERQ